MPDFKVLVLMQIATLMFAATPGHATEIPAAEAKNHIGEHATVCGKVVSEKEATNARGTPTFINLDSPYPKQVFTILIWGEDRPRMGDLPSQGSRVCVTGDIREYHGVPEIEIKEKAQLTQ